MKGSFVYASRGFARVLFGFCSGFLAGFRGKQAGFGQNIRRNIPGIWHEALNRTNPVLFCYSFFSRPDWINRCLEVFPGTAICVAGSNSLPTEGDPCGTQISSFVEEYPDGI